MLMFPFRRFTITILPYFSPKFPFMSITKTCLSLFWALCSYFAGSAQQSNKLVPSNANMNFNPLVTYSAKWKEDKYSNCNTAANTLYLSESEKEIIWILNLIRQNPKLAVESLLLNPKSPFYVQPSKRNHYYKSLVSTLNKIKPNSNPLFVDSAAFVSAQCHAISSGRTGYVGHERKKNECEIDFYGECCDYGHDNPLAIVMALLLDYDVPSLGHRDICLSTDYTLIGTSIQPHKTYGYNAVLDFK